jgi:hypothetical protein
MEAWEILLDVASGKGYIKDRELDCAPELLSTEEKLMGAMKEELPGQMEAQGQLQLTFPIIQNMFIFSYIKGFEAAYHYCQKVDHPDDIQLTDMITGCVKVDMSREMADYANSRPIPDDLFFAFQNWAFENRERIDSGKIELENELFKSLQWVFRIGVSVAMDVDQ